jgi:hypothetical protein
MMDITAPTARYFTKPQRVEAWKFTLPPEIRQRDLYTKGYGVQTTPYKINGYTVHTDSHGAFVAVYNANKGQLKARQGDYVILFPNGDKDVVREADFPYVYELKADAAQVV